MLTARAVHGSSRVGLVPNPNSTRQHWVVKILTRNQLEWSFKSADLGHIGFRGVSIGFRFVEF